MTFHHAETEHLINRLETNKHFYEWFKVIPFDVQREIKDIMDLEFNRIHEHIQDLEDQLKWKDDM